MPSNDSYANSVYDSMQAFADRDRIDTLTRERDKWRDLAVRLAKLHEPYVPMFPSDEARRRTASGALLDEIYAK